MTASSPIPAPLVPAPEPGASPPADGQVIAARPAPQSGRPEPAADAPQVPTLLDLHPAPADLLQLVEQGLARQPRQLPAWLLYDETGSRLFDQICEQPEYSLTRTETALLEQQADAIAARLGAGCLVEFGAGSARKVSPLLRALSRAGRPAYVALDISAEHLAAACRRLADRHADVPILGICCDYSALEVLPDHPLLRQRRLGFYPGSSIGNFDGPEARALLARLRRLLGPGGELLIGLDQPREVALMEAAYDDRAGVSAAFARNLLIRLNRDLAGDFQPEAFRYRAWWEAEQSRIAMALIADRPQTVRLAGRSWAFRSGEALITEYSVKYTPEAFAGLAAAAGWSVADRWSDPSGQVALVRLLQADSQQCGEPG